MNRSTHWKTLTVGAVMATMSVTGIATGIATATAAPAPVAKIPSPSPPSSLPAPPMAPAPAAVTAAPTDCTTGGADAERVRTNGSTAIRTAPSGTAEAMIRVRAVDGTSR